MRLVLVAVAVVLVGCGGRAPCSQASGAYRMRADARTGNCGQTVEVVVVLPNQTPAGCIGSSTVSEDGCEGSADYTCPDGQGGSMRMTGQLELMGGGTSGTGAMAIEARNSSGYVYCQGSYDVTYEKL